MTKSGVCIAGIANGNIAGNLVSCLKEIDACPRTRVTRPRNSLRDKSPRGSYPADGFMKYGRVNDFESDTIPISDCHFQRND